MMPRIKIHRRMHITYTDERPAPGAKTTALCGRRKRVVHPDTVSLLGFCSGCVQGLMIQNRARTIQLNDALQRLIDMAEVLDRPGAAKSERPRDEENA